MPNELEKSAFTPFVERMKPLVFRWALGLVGDADEAEDVTQETFVVAYQRLGSFRGDGSIEGWIYRITRRVAERRRGKARRRKELGALPAARPTNEVYLTDPGARVDRERALVLIWQAVSKLPPRQREVFDLCDMQGHSPTEAADMLDMKPTTVRANLFKARTAVRRGFLREHPHYAERNQ